MSSTPDPDVLRWLHSIPRRTVLAYAVKDYTRTGWRIVSHLLGRP